VAILESFKKEQRKDAKPVESLKKELRNPLKTVKTSIKKGRKKVFLVQGGILWN
jgi:hypothetical protein